MEATLALFQQYDRNGNGTIESIELLAVLTALDEYWTRARVGILLNALDADADGVLSYEEFLKWVSGDASVSEGLKKLQASNLRAAKEKISRSVLENADAILEKEEHDA